MIAPKETVRAFIAATVSTEARIALKQTTGRLRQAIPQGVAWTKPYGFHVTLKFLGNMRLELVDCVFASLMTPASGASPFRLGLSTLGVFPNSRSPRVLWAGLSGDLEALSALQGAVDKAMTQLGFAREDRPYAPHLTLGRVRRGVSDVARSKISGRVTAARQPTVQPWLVDEVHLFRTDLHPLGAEHTVIASIALGRPNATRRHP